MRIRFGWLLCGLALAMGLALPARADGPAWTSSGPYGGTVRCLAISPAFGADQTLFAGTDSGALFISTNSGQSWNPVSGMASGLRTNGVAVSPAYTDDGTLFIATQQNGVLRSRDRGQSWSVWSDGLGSLAVTQVALSASFDRDQIALAATDRGVHKTVSAGKVWYAVGPTVNALALAVGPRSGEQFDAFAGTVIGLYASHNAGETWEPTSLNGVPVITIALAPGYPSDPTVLAGTLAGVYLSRDGGATWDGLWLEDQVVHHVLFSPRYASDGTLFAGTEEGLYVSTDRGNSWTPRGALQSTVHALAAWPGEGTLLRIFAGTGAQGFAYSPDTGSTWQARNQGITDYRISAVAVSPNYVRDVTVFAGGPGGLWRSRDDGQSWQVTDLASAEVNAIACALDYARSGKVYAATRGGVFVSYNQGAQWQPTAGSLDVLNILDLAIGPSGEIWLATAEGGVYYSGDGGANWQPRINGLGSLQITSIEYLGSEGDKRFLLAGTWGAGVFRTEDGGLTWTPPSTETAIPQVRALASGTGFSGRVWSFGATPAGVFRSGDLGRVWDFAGLIGLDIATVTMHPDYASRPNCYVGSLGNGVMRSLNGGLTWQPLNDGLGNLRIHDLETGLNPDSSVTLFAGSAAGVWRYGAATRLPEMIESQHAWLPLICRNTPGGPGIATVSALSGYAGPAQQAPDSPQAPDAPTRQNR